MCRTRLLAHNEAMRKVLSSTRRLMAWAERTYKVEDGATVFHLARKEIEKVLLPAEEAMTIVFLDMDGVIADFHVGVTKLFPEWTHEVGTFGTLTPEQWNQLGYAFWRDLPFTPDGLDIFSAIEEVFGADRVFLCSSPCDTDGCLDGKREWVRRNLPHGYVRRFIPTSYKELLAGPNRLLIDDADKNVEAFADAAGKAILIPRPWNSLHEKVKRWSVHSLHRDLRYYW